MCKMYDLMNMDTKFKSSFVFLYFNSANIVSVVYQTVIFLNSIYKSQTPVFCCIAIASKIQCMCATHLDGILILDQH